MQTQFKQFKDCEEHDLICYGSKLYYKIPPTYFIDSESLASMYNAVNAETGEVDWIDGVKKVEVLAQ